MEKKDRMMKEDGKKRVGKQEPTKGHQTERRVKWLVKNSNMVCKLTELINNPLKEHNVGKKNLT